MRDPRVCDRRMIAKYDSALLGLGLPMRFYETKPRKPTPAPTLGQHSAAILAELGNSSSHSDRLRKSGVFG